MKNKIAGNCKKWFSDESGMSDAAAAIFILPTIAFLIFALIDTGINFRYRAKVDEITQLTVRSMSVDGAAYWVRTTRLPYTPSGGTYNPASFKWEQWGYDNLQKLCNDSGRCKSAPEMTCSITGEINDTEGRGIAPARNSLVTCSSVFPYKPVSPLSYNPYTSLGFSLFLNKPIESTTTGLTIRGKNG